MRRLMTKLSKYYLLLAGLVLGVVLVVGSTIALLSANSGEPILNKLAVASVATKIDEEVSKEPVAVETDIKKAVRVENTGEDAVFIRARIVVSPEKLWTDGKISLKYGMWNDGVFSQEGELAKNPADLVKIDSMLDGGFWRYSSDDGYYYYSELVPGTDEAVTDDKRFTDYLLGAVQLSSDMTAEDTFDLTVYQESVIAKGYSNSLIDQKAAFAAVADNDND